MSRVIYVVEAGRNAYPHVTGSDFEILTHPEFSDRGAPIGVLPIYHPRGGDPELMNVLSSFLSNGAMLRILTERPAGSPSDVTRDYPAHLMRLIEACEGHGVIGNFVLQTLLKSYPGRISVLS